MGLSESGEIRLKKNIFPVEYLIHYSKPGFECIHRA
jgi:hypothetical protein